MSDEIRELVTRRWAEYGLDDLHCTARRRHVVESGAGPP